MGGKRAQAGATVELRPRRRDEDSGAEIRFFSGSVGDSRGIALYAGDCVVSTESIRGVCDEGCEGAVVGFSDDPSSTDVAVDFGDGAVVYVDRGLVRKVQRRRRRR